MTTCNLCGAPVIWARTKPAEGKRSKPVPLDAEPAPRGNAWFEKGLVVFASKDRPRPPGARLFSSHFIGCDGYKTKKALARALSGEPECCCRSDECFSTCVACAMLDIGEPCIALGVPRGRP